MLPLLLTCALWLPQQPASVSSEPDGSRAVGTAPAFHGEPRPPEWLRARSHSIAAVDTPHYVYEVYAGHNHKWLVRYVMLPEVGEAFREIEQAFLFDADPAKKPLEVPPSEILFDVKSATWKKQAFDLVERRELLRP